MNRVPAVEVKAGASVAADTYRIRAHTVGGGVSRAACKAQEITVDSSVAGSDSLPGPAELLCAAFAACLLKNVERFATLLPFRYRQASVEVTARRQDAPPRFTRIAYELRVRTDEPEHRVDLLHRNLRRFGTVYNTLAAACEVEGTLVAERDDDAE